MGAHAGAPLRKTSNRDVGADRCVCPNTQKKQSPPSLRDTSSNAEEEFEREEE